tara:strand:+ start:61406 stop:61672 length:267 start_codon:yes stop_codon:yes gene_type:complete
MITPISVTETVFKETLKSIIKEVPIHTLPLPKVQVQLPTVPVSTMKIKTGVKSGITPNQIIACILIGAFVLGVIYYFYKLRQAEIERS